MEAVLEKRQLTPDTFKQKRFDLYKAENWTEYQELLEWEVEEHEKAFADSITVVCKALDLPKALLLISAASDGGNVASLSALTNFIDDSEKTKKPKLTKIETIQQLCFMADERTRLTIEVIESGSGKSVKATDVAGKQKFLHVMEAKVLDAYYDKYKIPQDEIVFAARYYKADLEPVYQQKQQECMIKIHEVGLANSQVDARSN